MEVVFPACSTITYIADILTKQTNTVGNTLRADVTRGVV